MAYKAPMSTGVWYSICGFRFGRGRGHLASRRGRDIAVRTIDAQTTARGVLALVGPARRYPWGAFQTSGRVDPLKGGCHTV